MTKEGRPGLRRHQPVPGVSPSKPRTAKSPNPNVDRWINVDETKSNYNKPLANKIMRKLNRDLSPRPGTCRRALRPRRNVTPDSNDGNTGFSPSSSSESDIEIRVPVKKKIPPNRTKILELTSDDREFKYYDIPPIEDVHSLSSVSNNWHFGRVYSEEIHGIMEKHFKKFKGDYLSKFIVGEIFQDKISDVPVDFGPNVAFELIEVTQLENLYSFRNGRKSRLMFKSITMTTTNNKQMDIQDRERTILAVDSLADLLNLTLKQGDFLVIFGDPTTITNNKNNVIALNSRLESGCFIAHYRHDGVFSPFQNDQEQGSEGCLANLDLEKFNYVYQELGEDNKEIVIKIQPNLKTVLEKRPPQTPSTIYAHVISKGTQITPPQATIPHVEAPVIHSDTRSSRPSSRVEQQATSKIGKPSPRTKNTDKKDAEGELFYSDNDDDDHGEDIQQMVELVSIDSSDDEQSEFLNVNKSQHQQNKNPKSSNRNRVSSISPISSRSTPKRKAQKKDKEIKLDQDEILLLLEEDIENSSDESFQSCIDLDSDLEEDLNSQQSQSQTSNCPNVIIKKELSSISIHSKTDLHIDAQLDLNVNVNNEQQNSHHSFPPSSPSPMESNENLHSIVEKKVADFIANVKKEKSQEQHQLQQVLQDFPISSSDNSDGLPRGSSTQGSDQNNPNINNINDNNNNNNDSDNAKRNEISNDEVEKKVHPSLLLNLRHRQVDKSPTISPNKRKQSPTEPNVQDNNNTNNSNKRKKKEDKTNSPTTTTTVSKDLHEDLNNNSVQNIHSPVPEQVPTTSTSNNNNTKSKSRIGSVDEEKEFKKKYKLRAAFIRIKRMSPSKTSKIVSQDQTVINPQENKCEIKTRKMTKLSEDKEVKKLATELKEKNEEIPKKNKSANVKTKKSPTNKIEQIKISPRLRSADRELRSGKTISPGSVGASPKEGNKRKLKSDEGKKKPGRPPIKKKKPDHVATPKTRRKSQIKRNRF